MSNPLTAAAPRRYAAVPNAALSHEKSLVLERVPAGARVLEIGAHTGDFSAVLTAHGCRVTAVEANAIAAADLAGRVDTAIVGSIEDPAVQARITGTFDVVLAMHVLEHLVDPWAVVARLAGHLAPGGLCLVLLPNVGAWTVRKDLFFKGSFEYEDVGILDRTHVRFFTIDSGRALIESAGLVVTNWMPAHVCIPFERRLRLLTRSSRLASAWARWFTRRYPGVASEIVLFEARRRAGAGAR